MRVALFGYGSAGESLHARLISATVGLDLAAIVTRDPKRRERARLAHPGAKILDSAAEIWSRAEGLDLVVVATPNRFHTPLAQAALGTGLGVVVDKPFTATATEGMALVELARSRRLLLTVFHNRRLDRDFLAVRSLVDDGEVGEVIRFESRLDRVDEEILLGWRGLGDTLDAGGVLFDIGSHVVDQALQLFGPVRKVYAELDRRRPGVEVDDDAFVALLHASGVRSHLWTSFVAERGPRFRLIGMKGTREVEGIDEPDPALYRPFYEGVVASLREGAPPPVRAEDAVAVVKVLEAAQRSAREGVVVGL